MIQILVIFISLFYFMFSFLKKAPEIPQNQYRIGGRKDRMLRFLQDRAGQEIGLNVILEKFRDISEPCRVIRYLEADWYHIENRIEYTKQWVHSFYTYLGYDLLFKKKRTKKTKRELEIYNEWFQACKELYWLN